MRRIPSVALVIVATLIATGAILYARNWTPTVAAIATGDAAAAGAPWVVKLHAQWCPFCMLKKGMWAQIEDQYFADYRAAIDAAIVAAEP